MDKHLINSNQKHELEYICKTWYSVDRKRLKISDIKDIVKRIGRSRKNVYIVLRYLGYSYTPLKK